MRKLTLKGELSTVTQLSPGLLSITHQLWQHRLDDLTVQGTCPWLTTYLLVYLILRSLDLGKLYTFNPFFLHRIWWMGNLFPRLSVLQENQLSELSLYLTHTSWSINSSSHHYFIKPLPMWSSEVRLKTLSLCGKSLGAGQTTGGLKKRMEEMSQQIKCLWTRMETKTGSGP